MDKIEMAEGRASAGAFEAIPVFYRDEMNARCPLPSPSAGKPEKAVESWLRLGLPLKVEGFEPVDEAFFKLGHDAGHVEAVLACREGNGFGTFDEEVARSLFWTHGSLRRAGESALASGKVAVSPTSGFHHAGWRMCEGFCTFNALACSMALWLGTGKISKGAILDCDQHFGNGTEEILGKLRLADKVVHATARRHYKTNAKDFFEALPKWLARMEDCGLMVYQAGADCHVDDPHGGYLTSEQMRERDAMVFEFCAARGIPLCWNLAGGYQVEIVDGEPSIRKVLDLHDATMRECAKAFLRA